MSPLFIIFVIIIISIISIFVYKMFGTIIISIISILVYKMFCWNINPDITRFNRQMDCQHTGMLDLLDELKLKMIKHWTEESNLYKLGVKKGVYKGKYTPAEWKAHQNDHKNTLQKVDSMKAGMINHINTKDVEAFSWL